MSISTLIEQALSDGRLLHLPLNMPSDKTEREMLIHRDLYDHMMGGWPSDVAEERFGRLRADLEFFVTGGVISMGFDPRNHGTDTYMGRLDPLHEGTWDIRSRAPKPGMRVFGRFAEVDTFVALEYWFRSKTPNWSWRRALGKGNSLEYEIALVDAEQKWKELFHEYKPLIGGDCSDYISRDTIPVRSQK